jgi:Tfp pilus assembly protein FimT
MSYSLSLARAEAIRYGQTVTVSPIGGDWNNGWLITTPGIGGNPDIEIYQKEPLNSQLSVAQNGSLQGALQFNNIGSLVGNDVGLFTLSHTSSSEARNVRVSLSGTVKVTHP